MGREIWNRRGLTPVVSNILMCAVVLVIGTSVWGVASGSSSIMRSDYFDEVMESVDKIKERFCVENLGINIISQPSLQIWVLNYGSNTINITWIRIEGGGNMERIRVENDDSASSKIYGRLLHAGEIDRFDVVPTEVSLSSGLSISVRVKSERENKAYDRIRIP